MKILISTLSFSNVNPIKALELISKNGFRYIEASPSFLGFFSPNQDIIKEISNCIKNTKINIISLQSLFFGHKIHLDDDFIQNNYLYLKKIIQLSNMFSVENISIGNMPSRKLKLDNKIIKDINFKIISKIVNLLSNKEIKISIEPISRKYDVKFLNKHHEVSEFINEINSAKIQLLLDTGNLYDENLDFKTVYNKYKKSINHIHLSEVNLKKFNLKRIDEVLHYLSKENYRKSVSIEYVSDKGKNIQEIFQFLKQNYNRYL